AGNDVFVFATGDSGIVEADVDVITDWNAGDRLDLTGTISASNIASSTQASFAAALAAANAAFTGAGGVTVFVVQVGADVWVFSDLDGTGSAANDAIRILNTTLANVGADSII
ncbi:MAG: hypothetical protein ACK51C_10510, partial [Brevundimonas sp.]